MEQQLQLAESRILFGSENKEGQVRQKPPVSLPGAKFQSLASPCIQEHVPAIQNPPTHARRDSGGEENIEKGFAGQGRKLQPLQNGNIWNLEGRKTSVLYHCHLERFLNLGNLGIQVLKISSPLFVCWSGLVFAIPYSTIANSKFSWVLARDDVP